MCNTPHDVRKFQKVRFTLEIQRRNALAQISSSFSVGRDISVAACFNLSFFLRMISTKAFLLGTLALTTAGALTSCRTIDLDEKGDLQAVYRLGEFQMLVNHPAPATAQAAQAALQTLDLYQTKYQVNTYDAYVEARARNDQRVRIWIAEQNRNQTLVRIRWGEGGDLSQSRRLFDTIDRSLPPR